ncbi:DHH phosphoesterase [Mycena chlorophos]|uniref:DHH phosphoesterase n=1 Tax=Mycena chlorophos TaxID=658473 RepID=A0A8H6TKI0_MYCCL|nr:DHH phosphoesterase [Mycena chlorophos]
MLNLSTFLASSKSKYLADAKDWTVVMGNEAGDLDSVASSIAFAYIRSEIHKKPTVPLIRIAKEDLHLRAENLYALKLAGINDPATELLSVSEYPFPQAATQTTSFALVDHNRLAESFHDGRVVAVIDHHADEGLYVDTADPRVVAPSGSCASHIATTYAKDVELPPELATLLLSAILVDTDGLRAGGKALQVDHDAAAYLTPLSTLASAAASLSATDSANPVQSLSDELTAKKLDVSHLGAWDLLRRDYKQYTYTLHWGAGTSAPAPTITAGLSTVPVKLKKWGAGKGPMERDALRWMEQQGLVVLGVLTSFRAPKSGKHKREMAWFVRGEDSEELAARLWAGLEADEEIRVEKHKKLKLAIPDTQQHIQTRVYKQGNAKATRKATAPLLQKIMESRS